MSDRLPVAPFEPDGRASALPVERRGRLLVIAAGALLLALVASSVANTTRVGLRCVEGQLVAYRGSLMPAGEEPLDDPSLPPLSVATTACEDEELTDLSALRARHREITRSRMGEVIAHATPEELEPSTLDALTELPEDADEEARAERRTMLRSVVDAKVEHARKSQQEAVRWIEQARRAGVDPAHLRAAERMLGLAPPQPAAPAEPEPATNDEAPADPADASGARSL